MRARYLSLVALGLCSASCTTVVAPPPQQASIAASPASGQEFCREYTSKAVIDGTPQDMVGLACQQPDGRWKLVDGTAPPPDGPQASPPPTVVYPYPYPYYYYYPYPTYFGPSFGIFFGGRFGHHHHH
jgi:hypothetical protein